MTDRERYRWAALCSFTAGVCGFAGGTAQQREQWAWVAIFAAATIWLVGTGLWLAHGDEWAERRRKKIRT